MTRQSHSKRQRSPACIPRKTTKNRSLSGTNRKVYGGGGSVRHEGDGRRRIRPRRRSRAMNWRN